MNVLSSTARQLGMPVAVHTGAADGCKQATRCGARSLEHAYLIDAEGIAMAEKAGTFVVPTVQMTQEDLLSMMSVGLAYRVVQLAGPLRDGAKDEDCDARRLRKNCGHRIPLSSGGR